MTPLFTNPIEIVKGGVAVRPRPHGIDLVMMIPIWLAPNAMFERMKAQTSMVLRRAPDEAVVAIAKSNRLKITLTRLRLPADSEMGDDTLRRCFAPVHYAIMKWLKGSACNQVAFVYEQMTSARVGVAVRIEARN